MRTCVRSLPLFFALLNGLAILTIGLPAGAAAPQPGQVCGQDYFFEISGPTGWSLEHLASKDSVSMVYTQPGPNGEESPIAMAVTLPRGAEVQPVLDLDRVLTQRVATLSLYGDPREIRDQANPDRTRNIRSVRFELAAGVLHLSLIDTGSGAGDFFVASLVKEGADATNEEREAFRNTIASLAFDPGRACREVGGIVKIVERPRSFPASADPAAVTTPDAPEFDADEALKRAFSACHAMQRMLVPVVCRKALVAGEPALVLTFSDGTESGPVYLERFRERAAGTYCWARSQSELPPLYFRSQTKHDAPSALREYSCSRRDWGRTVAANAYSETS